MSLAPEILRLVKYPPERLIEARLTDLAATTKTPFFEAPTIEPYLIWLRRIAQVRNTNVEVFVEGKVVDREYEDRLAFGDALTILDDYTPLEAPFDVNAAVSFYNSGAIINNYQARVTYEVQEYRVADKLALGVGWASLDGEERRVAEKYLVRNKVLVGELPMPYPQGPLLYQYIGNYAGNMAADEEVPLVDRTVPPGQKAVLRLLWARRPAADFGDLVLRVYRERKLFLTIYPYCLPEYNTTTRYIRPVDLWIPSIDRLRVTVHSGTGHTGVLAQALIEMRQMTVWDKIAWGLTRNNRITSREEVALIEELDLRDKLAAGIYTLYTPVSV